MAALRTLVSGFGAVGQVFAWHLRDGGANVTIAVRSPQKLPRAVTLHRLDLRRRVRTESFLVDDVCATPDALRARTFDQVYVTVPSDALQDPWFRALPAALGDATVVSMLPGVDDQRDLRALGIPGDRQVQGLVSFVSFDARLVGAADGTAYWLPPLSRCPFTGVPERAKPVVDALTRGGLPAMRSATAFRLAPFFTAALMAHVASLEQASWSLDALLDPVRLARSADAARQAMALTARKLGAAPATARLLAAWPVLQLGLRAARRFAPFPFEPYLQAHFTKVGTQTRYLLGQLVADAKAAGQPHDALHLLAEPKSAPRLP